MEERTRSFRKIHRELGMVTTNSLTLIRGKVNGYGLYTYEDGSKYEGEWLNFK